MLMVLIRSLVTCATISAEAQDVILQLPADDQQMITAQLGSGAIADSDNTWMTLFKESIGDKHWILNRTITT